MPEDQSKLNPLDDRLAEFADQMLEQPDAQTPPALADDPELAGLQNVVVQLKQAGLSERPDTKFSARLKVTLQKEWQRSGPKPAPVQPSPLQQIKDYLQPIFAGRTWQVGLAVAAVLLLALFFLPQGGDALTGAAGTDAPFTGALHPMAFGLGILCAGILIWLLLKKKN